MVAKNLFAEVCMEMFSQKKTLNHHALIGLVGFEHHLTGWILL